MVDALIQVGIFATFIIFGVCIWLISRGKDEDKKTAEPPPLPPKNPNA